MAVKNTDAKNVLKNRVGRAITFFRKRKGMSQKYLALTSGLSISAMSELENGVTWPTTYSLSKILEVLEVTPERFFLECFSDHNAAVNIHVFRAKTILDKRVYKNGGSKA